MIFLHLFQSSSESNSAIYSFPDTSHYLHKLFDIMKTFIMLYSFAVCLAQAASAVSTGFNYGAFWGDPGNAKYKADFLEGFNLARNLSTPVPFDSARLFTCVAANTANDPIEAFDAAVVTKTKLLLGFWISPQNRGDSPDAQVKNEMAALEKGFNKHGQTLADLVIGLSVGSEDIYRWEEKKDESGVSADVVSATIADIRENIASSSFAKYMHGKPIGHVDVAKYAVVEGADFYGMTAYPYWNKDGIDKARDSFQGSLENVKQRAGNTPVWIAEMGWPVEGAQQGASIASLDNLQTFWTEVGCSVVGMYTTFWFELLKDTTIEQPDWGFIDIPSKQPRIKDLSCPGGSKPNVTTAIGSGSPTSDSNLPTAPTSLQTSAAASVPFPSSVTKSGVTSASTFAPTTTSGRTTHVTTTIYVTVQPTSPALNHSATAVDEVTVTITTTIYEESVVSSIKRSHSTLSPWCVTVADIDRNGHPVTIAGGPAGPDGKCSAPPTYYGYPYVSGSSVRPTAVPKSVPWCVTMADIDRNNRPVPVDAGPAGPGGTCMQASTYTGYPYVGRPLSSSSVPYVPMNGSNTATSFKSSTPAASKSLVSMNIASSVGPKKSSVTASSATVSALSSTKWRRPTSAPTSSLPVFAFPAEVPKAKSADTAKTDSREKRRWWPYV